MADVYQARDETLGRDVAVKLLRDRTPDPSDRARFVAEAQTLARLNHPNLVTILDAGISDEHPFLVLELVVGTSLSVALTHTGAGLSPRRVAHIGGQIAAALAHCHAAGVVHRDVKPGNVLLGAGDRALLTDFGISRLLDGTTHHTQTGFTIGTASYLAPEQVHGAEITPAVDLYALGLVLLEACTGHREYAGTPVEAAVARLHRSPRLPVDLPSGLARTVTALTQTDPALRPGAVETAQALGDGASLGDTPIGSLGVATAPHGSAGFAEAAAVAYPVERRSEALPHAAAEDRRRRTPVLAIAGWVAAAAAAIALILTLHGASPTPATGSTSQPEKPASPSRTPSVDASPAADISPPAPTTRPATVASKPRSSARSSAGRQTKVSAPSTTAPGKAKKAAPVKKAKPVKKTTPVKKTKKPGKGRHGSKGK